MKKQAIILLVILLAFIAILFWFFLQGEKSEGTIRSRAEEDFYAYLELSSISGEFLEFDEAKSELSILYLTPETMKVVIKSFKIDKETIFSKMALDSHQPNLFPKEDLKKIEQEARITIFYLTVENKTLLARLIQAEASF